MIRHRPGRVTAIAKYLIETQFENQEVKTLAIVNRFPGATYAEVMGAEAMAMDIVKARNAATGPRGCDPYKIHNP